MPKINRKYLQQLYAKCKQGFRSIRLKYKPLDVFFIAVILVFLFNIISVYWSGEEVTRLRFSFRLLLPVIISNCALLSIFNRKVDKSFRLIESLASEKANKEFLIYAGYIRVILIILLIPSICLYFFSNSTIEEKLLTDYKSVDLGLFKLITKDSIGLFCWAMVITLIVYYIKVFRYIDHDVKVTDFNSKRLTVLGQKI